MISRISVYYINNFENIKIGLEASPVAASMAIPDCNSGVLLGARGGNGGSRDSNY